MSKDPSTLQPLDGILSRVRYIGPEPSPSEDEVMGMVVDMVSAARDRRLRPPRRRPSGNR